jgi:FtsZ-interacting cell division protein ZipA
MSTTGWIILAVVVVVVVLVALMAWRAQHRRKMAARAQELRSEARAHAPEVGQTRQEAREAEVRAEAARLEAERAQRDADAAKTALAQQEAVHEDRLREADRLDPAVDHEADDYEPTAPDGYQSAAEDGRHPTIGGEHRREE